MVASIISILAFICSAAAAAAAVYANITLSKFPGNDKLRSEINDIKDEILDLQRADSNASTRITDLTEVVEQRYSRMAARESRRNKAEEKQYYRELLELQMQERNGLQERADNQGSLPFEAASSDASGYKPKLQRVI